MKWKAIKEKYPEDRSEMSEERKSVCRRLFRLL